MNLQTLFDIIQGESTSVWKKETFRSIQIDSRKVKKGDLFLVLKGRYKNGADYIKEAIQHKCLGVIVEEPICCDIPYILVKDTKQALLDYAHFIRCQYAIPIIAVTGSVGKTTTKELIASILSCKYQVLKSDGNYNNHIGVPLTLMKLHSNYDIAVLEMGMNHKGEIKRLAKCVEPTIGIITNIGTAHIGNLGSIRQIFKAKMELLQGMRPGKLILNGEDSYLKKVKSKYPIYRCGFHPKDQLTAFQVQCSLEKTSFLISVYGKEYQVTTSLLGAYFIPVLLCAIEVGLQFQVPIDAILNTIATYQPEELRLSKIKLKNDCILYEDCYNASLESLLNWCDLLQKEEKPIVLILGDILELGSYSAKLHKKLAKAIKKIRNVRVLFVGEEGKTMVSILKEKCDCFSSNQEVIAWFLTHPLETNSFLLLKGSRNMKLEEIGDYLKQEYKW